MIGNPAGSFTCPAGFRAVLTSVDMWSGAVSVGIFFLRHQPSGSQAIAVDIGLNANGIGNWRGRFAFDAGESIELNAPNHIDVEATGFLFAL